MPLIPQEIKQKKIRSEQIKYKNLVKLRFKQQVSRIVGKYSIEELILVLDINATMLVSNLFKIHQLVEMKIIYLQRLEVKRKRMPEMHALYFIPPSSKLVQLIKNDFPEKALGQDKSKRQYKKIHILFTSFVSHGILKQIATYKPLLKRIATNSIKQFYHSSIFLSESVVNFGVEGYGAKAFSKDSEQQKQKRVRISEKIMEFVVNLGEINKVRLLYKRSSNGISQRVAQYSQKMINKYIGNLLQSKSYLLKSTANDVTILIFDRSVDPITPLLHSFTYQSLLFDLLKVCFEGSSKAEDKQYYKFTQFNDDIYQKYRYHHISKALQELPQMLNKQNQKLLQLQKPLSPLQKRQQEKAQDNQIDITQLNELVNQLRRHIEMLDILFKQLKGKQLTTLGQLQMCLATGLTQEGKNTSSEKLYTTVLQNIQINKKLTKQDKIRLGLVVLCCIKLSKKDYQKLLQKFPDEDDKWILKNIIALGITYDKGIGRSTKAISKDQQKIAMQRMEETKIPLDRYTCILQLLVPMMVEILSGENAKIKRLDQSIFGTLKCISIQEQQLDIIKFNKERLVLIMVGGISFAQISAIRRKQSMKNIIIGADEIIDPKQYLQMLKNIDILR